MYSAEQIRKLEIKKSTFGGYNMDEVDDVLDEAADSIELLQKQLAEAQAQAKALADKLDAYSTSESSIHSAIINAQRLADQTIKEASESAGHTIADANMKAELTVKEAEEKANVILQQAEEKADVVVNDAIAKTESMIAAAHDSVARQQLLFDKLKVETAQLKETVMQHYARQVELLTAMPDEVPFDAQRAAQAIAFAYDQLPDYNAMAAGARPVASVEEPAVCEESDETDYARVLADAVAAAQDEAQKEAAVASAD